MTCRMKDSDSWGEVLIRLKEEQGEEEDLEKESQTLGKRKRFASSYTEEESDEDEVEDEDEDDSEEEEVEKKRARTQEEDRKRTARNKKIIGRAQSDANEFKKAVEKICETKELASHVRKVLDQDKDCAANQKELVQFWRLMTVFGLKKDALVHLDWAYDVVVNYHVKEETKREYVEELGGHVVEISRLGCKLASENVDGILIAEHDGKNFVVGGLGASYEKFMNDSQFTPSFCSPDIICALVFLKKYRAKTTFFMAPLLQKVTSIVNNWQACPNNAIEEASFNDGNNDNIDNDNDKVSAKMPSAPSLLIGDLPPRLVREVLRLCQDQALGDFHTYLRAKVKWDAYSDQAKEWWDMMVSKAGQEVSFKNRSQLENPSEVKELVASIVEHSFSHFVSLGKKKFAIRNRRSVSDGTSSPTVDNDLTKKCQQLQKKTDELERRNKELKDEVKRLQDLKVFNIDDFCEDPWALDEVLSKAVRLSIAQKEGFLNWLVKHGPSPVRPAAQDAAESLKGIFEKAKKEKETFLKLKTRAKASIEAVKELNTATEDAFENTISVFKRDLAEKVGTQN